jgi:hypothetical protein
VSFVIPLLAQWHENLSGSEDKSSFHIDSVELVIPERPSKKYRFYYEDQRLG